MTSWQRPARCAASDSALSRYNSASSSALNCAQLVNGLIPPAPVHLGQLVRLVRPLALLLQLPAQLLRLTLCKLGPRCVVSALQRLHTLHKAGRLLAVEISPRRLRSKWPRTLLHKLSEPRRQLFPGLVLLAQQTGLGHALGYVLGRDGQLCGHRLSQ